MSRNLTQQEIDELICKYCNGELKELTSIHEVIYRKGAEQLRNILSQQEIDALFAHFNKSRSDGWTWTTVQDGQPNVMERFKHDEVYTVEDYDLFYCKYALEELTSCASLLRRYAYGDTESFKKFKYFIVLEEYKSKGINAALVTGAPSDEFCSMSDIYSGCREKGIAYLVDASSLFYSFKINDKESVL